MKFTIGQEVFATASFGRRVEEKMTIIRTDSTFVYTSSRYGERKFNIVTGAESILGGGFIGGKIFTIDSREVMEQRSETIRDLHDMGIELGTMGNLISSENLEQILIIVQGSQT